MRKLLASILIVLPAFAGDPWKRPASTWTDADAQRVLSASPWAKTVGQSKMTVRWESARPVRLALARLQKTALADNSCYAIAVVGLEMPAQPPTLEASLKATGRKAIAAFGVKLREDRIVFQFPRLEEVQEPIVFRLPVGPKIGDTVEFETRIGSQLVKEKFCLRSMKYEGKLAL